MYSATHNNFLGTDPVILRNLGPQYPVKTEHLPTWLNGEMLQGDGGVYVSSLELVSIVTQRFLYWAEGGSECHTCCTLDVYAIYIVCIVLIGLE